MGRLVNAPVSETTKRFWAEYNVRNMNRPARNNDSRATDAEFTMAQNYKTLGEKMVVSGKKALKKKKKKK
jgi:hypothetical protein